MGLNMIFQYPHLHINLLTFYRLLQNNYYGKFSQKLFSFLGPGLLVAVGYMDPGNWITSMQALKMKIIFG
jgi:hypothetical protein